MKKLVTYFMIFALLLTCGCVSNGVSSEAKETPFVSKFESENKIELSDDEIKLNGNPIEKSGDVFISNDVIYYEDKETYESGYPYGEGDETERHNISDAATTTVLNITKSGRYVISGKLSQGQIRVDLGEGAKENPDAVVELVLNNADITCSLAPAILFLNVYECDLNDKTENASENVDIKNCGAVLVLAKKSENNINGSHVAKIFKDAEDEKKLWKQDGAIYSYMSMNIYGPGVLNLVADNEGIDTEKHLAINGGNINVYSNNDGINTNEDGISVTQINGGNIHIIAGLGAEGDGIDSNGWIVVNGGNLVLNANPAADSGLDSDKGSFINGGTVIAFGSSMNQIESNSSQASINLQFEKPLNSEDAITIKDEKDKTVFEYKCENNEKLAGNERQTRGVIISSPNLKVGDNYSIYVGETKLSHSGMNIRGGGFGMGRPIMPKGERHEMLEGERPEMAEGERPEIPQGERPDMPKGERPDMPKGERPEMTEGERPEMPNRSQHEPLDINKNTEKSDVFKIENKANSYFVIGT